MAITKSSGSGLPDWIQQIQARNSQRPQGSNSLFGQWGQSGMNLEGLLQQMMSGGLGEYGDMLKRQGEGNIGQYKQGAMQGLREEQAARGNVSGRTLNQGFGQVSGQAGSALQNLYSDIEGKNQQAKQFGMTSMQGALGQLGQLKLGRDKLAEMGRQFDEQNSFDFFKDIFGPLLSGGSSVLGSYLGK